MSWKLIRRILLVFLVLLIVVPAVLYLIAIDHSRSYSKSVSALSAYEGQTADGLYRLAVEDHLDFKIRIAGFEHTGEDVILLHGFPQTSVTWRPLMDAAAEQGYRVLAFDQRGYSPGARPSGSEHYHICLLYTSPSPRDS